MRDSFIKPKTHLLLFWTTLKTFILKSKLGSKYQYKENSLDNGLVGQNTFTKSLEYRWNLQCSKNTQKSFIHKIKTIIFLYFS